MQTKGNDLHLASSDSESMVSLGEAAEISERQNSLNENNGKSLGIDSDQSNVLKVIVSGGGPVGLSFALLLERLMGKRVAIQIYDGRWTEKGSQVVWKSDNQGNARRQQVVTIQSRQFLKFPQEMQDQLFQEGLYTEMWPEGPDSIQGVGPRNVRIAHIEDQLLQLANEKTDSIELIPARFDAREMQNEIEQNHLLVICEGGRSRTRDHFIDKFGEANKSMYSLDGEHVQDVVLGLRVKSELSDPMTLLLTVAQNRFLLNSLNGSGFLNMRLTDDEVREVVGIDIDNHEFKDCIQSQPCVMERSETEGVFQCSTHKTLFLPAMFRGSALWARIQEGMKLFGVQEENLEAVTSFRLDMVQRPRFTTQLFHATENTPGTYGCLLGDAANSIHFWPGRGLNSGLASAVSLVRCLYYSWKGRPLREADFTRHEALMSMLQYRHKSRAWRAMVTADNQGTPTAIKSKIREGIIEGEVGSVDKASDVEILLERMTKIRSRLDARVSNLPDDQTLRDHLMTVDAATLRTLAVSGEWDTAPMGGEEVEVDLLFEEPEWPEIEVASKAEPKQGIAQILAGTQSADGMSESSGLSMDSMVTFVGHKIESSPLANLIYAAGDFDGRNLPRRLMIKEGATNIRIGRNSTWGNLVIPDNRMSRKHALLTIDDARNLYIKDVASAGGTFVNGRQLESNQAQLLQHDDVIRFGREITYRVELLDSTIPTIVG